MYFDKEQSQENENEGDFWVADFLDGVSPQVILEQKQILEQIKKREAGRNNNNAAANQTSVHQEQRNKSNSQPISKKYDSITTSRCEADSTGSAPAESASPQEDEESIDISDSKLIREQFEILAKIKAQQRIKRSSVTNHQSDKQFESSRSDQGASSFDGEKKRELIAKQQSMPAMPSSRSDDTPEAPANRNSPGSFVGDKGRQQRKTSKSGGRTSLYIRSVGHTINAIKKNEAIVVDCTDCGESLHVHHGAKTVLCSECKSIFRVDSESICPVPLVQSVKLSPTKRLMKK